jgi:hypothetical protein
MDRQGGPSQSRTATGSPSSRAMCHAKPVSMQSSRPSAAGRSSKRSGDTATPRHLRLPFYGYRAATPHAATVMPGRAPCPSVWACGTARPRPARDVSRDVAARERGVPRSYQRRRLCAALCLLGTDAGALGCTPISPVSQELKSPSDTSFVDEYPFPGMVRPDSCHPRGRK